jgi:hypothetical protein
MLEYLTFATKGQKRLVARGLGFSHYVRGLAYYRSRVWISKRQLCYYARHSDRSTRVKLPFAPLALGYVPRSQNWYNLLLAAGELWNVNLKSASDSLRKLLPATSRATCELRVEISPLK